MTVTNQPASVTVFGEALIDVIPTRGAGFEGRAGGSPANIAVATSRLGCPTSFLGGLSTDRWGQLLTTHLEDAGVVTDDAPRSDRPTAMALVDLADDGSAIYRFLWDHTADRGLTLDDLPADLGSSTWLQVGSVAAAFEDTGAAVADLVAREHPNRLVSCDPNVRPMVHGTSTAVTGRMVHLMERADLVKCSGEDLAFLMPSLGVDQAIAELLSGGAGAVAITRGSAGAVVGSAAGSATIAAVRGNVIDTVGAGDTFMAGLLAGLSDAGVRTRDDLHDIDLDTVEAVGTMAATAAAITVSRAGANPPTRAELTSGN